MPLNRILSFRSPFSVPIVNFVLLRNKNSIAVQKLNRSFAFISSISTVKSAASINFSMNLRHKKTIPLLFVPFWLNSFQQKAEQASADGKSSQTIEMQLIGQDFAQTTFSSDCNWFYFMWIIYQQTCLLQV